MIILYNGWENIAKPCILYNYNSQILILNILLNSLVIVWDILFLLCNVSYAQILIT